MRYYTIDIDKITYRVKNEKTNRLPKRYRNVCVEIDPDTLDDLDKWDFIFRNAAGMFIMNETGYTPEDFTWRVKEL